MNKDKIRGRRLGNARKNFKQKLQGGHKGQPVLRVIPLGGLEEVGKNSMVFECGKDIVAIDMGLQFPEENMLGIDYVVPDVTYLEERRKNIRGIIITHGHLDHIGGLRHVLPKLGFPTIYATKLTMGLIKKQLAEYGVLDSAKLEVITPDSVLRLGDFRAGFFRVNHSIPDGVGVYLKSPAGSIVHTGDFKFDAHPADDKPAEIKKMQALGRKKGNDQIDILFSDSTNAIKPGRTVSEKVIGDELDRLIERAGGRIIIASFSSLIGRIQQILNSAAKHGRIVAVSGMSMENNINIARELGYLKVPQGVLKPLKQVLKAPPGKTILITTGSQGEAMAALARMATNDHKHVKIQNGDTVVLSSSPIIGNERAVAAVKNNLCRLGANIVTNEIMDVHTSGHACQEDLLQMMGFVRPRNLAPVHGDLYMRTTHKMLAVKKGGFREENVIVLDNGSVLELSNGKILIKKEKIPVNYIVVDGLGTGDIGSQVLVDREAMSQNGVLVVVFKVDKKTKKLKDKPLVLSRGFIYVNESDEIIKKLKEEAEKAYKYILGKDSKASAQDVCNYVKGVLDSTSHKKLARKPLIVPWVMNV
ncbi:MAG: ribonuclease J [Patescibacteria group bacterium]|nr:ribonuclease J [Patescibacteria group bacterium]